MLIAILAVILTILYGLYWYTFGADDKRAAKDEEFPPYKGYEHHVEPHKQVIAELKKIVDDMQAKLEGKLASLDEKLDQKLEVKIEAPVVEKKEYEITDLSAEDVETRKKHIEERNKHLG